MPPALWQVAMDRLVLQALNSGNLLAVIRTDKEQK
jgi:hypothetical protein